ncbi:MAG: hypothetical protein AAB214_07125 [Fibrobacterota bacterium]
MPIHTRNHPYDSRNGPVDPLKRSNRALHLVARTPNSDPSYGGCGDSDHRINGESDNLRCNGFQQPTPLVWAMSGGLVLPASPFKKGEENIGVQEKQVLCPPYLNEIPPFGGRSGATK